MKEHRNGTKQAKALHHTYPRGVEDFREPSTGSKQEQIRSDRNADFRQTPLLASRREAPVGGILRGLITSARAQIKLLEDQIELWQEQLDNLEHIEGEDGDQPE